MLSGVSLNNSDENYYLAERKEISVLLPKQYSKVLEIGCGKGGFRKNLSSEHTYWGVEPVEAIAKLAENNLDKVLVGTYQDIKDLIPNNYFDLVICNDVIEHIPDHDQFFQSIKQKMTTDASLIASIPNVRYIWNLWEVLVKKDWQYKSAGILDRTHLRFFTEKSLRRTLKDNAFSIEQWVELNSYQPLFFRNKIIYSFLLLLFGRDIKPLQFGVRLKKTD